MSTAKMSIAQEEAPDTYRCAFRAVVQVVIWLNPNPNPIVDLELLGPSRANYLLLLNDAGTGGLLFQ